jgi:hypothetical protein
MMNFLSKYRYWIFIWIIFLFLRLPSLFEPYWYGDEGIYLTLGQGIRRGLILYSQIHDNKPPTLYYLASIFPTMFGFRLLLSLVMIPTVFLFYKLSLIFLKEKFAKISTFVFVVLTSIPLFEGNISNAENFMLLPTIAGFLIFLKAKKNIHYFVASFLLGIAFTIKIPVFIEFVFLFIWLFLMNFESLKKNFKKNFFPLFFKLFIFGISFLLPIILWSLYFLKLGAFRQFLGSALLQNFSYLSSWATGTQTASASSGGLMTRLIILLISWIVFYFLFLKKKISSQNTFILCWLVATVFGVLLSTRPYPHYLIQLLPPFCLIIFCFRKKSIFSNITNITSLLLILTIILSYKFYHYSTFKYYKNFYSFQLKSSYYTYFGPDVLLYQDLSNYIKENTNLNDYIFVWGDQSYVYAMTNRTPPGRYTVAYHIVDFDGYDETINSIKSNFPKFIIYSFMENRPFPKLDDIINRYYFLDKKFKSVLIFQKR